MKGDEEKKTKERRVQNREGRGSGKIDIFGFKPLFSAIWIETSRNSLKKQK